MGLLQIDGLFEDLPEKLRKQLIDEFRKIHDEYAYGKYQATELNVARFCEVVYTVIEGYQNGQYDFEARKPKNMVVACRKLEGFSGEIPHSMKVLIPRLLPALYDIRNNRNVGHTQGDIDPNYMDSTLSYKAACWIMAELIRVFHDLEMDGAQRLVDRISSSGNLPLIWPVNDRQRVLDNSLSMFDQTLIILYHTMWRLDKDLCADVEYSNFSTFKREILRKGHKQRLWEYDCDSGEVEILPLGSALAEEVMQGIVGTQ